MAVLSIYSYGLQHEMWHKSETFEANENTRVVVLSLNEVGLKNDFQ